MNVGELVAKIKLDRSDLDRGLMAMRRMVRGFREKITVDVDDKKVTKFLGSVAKIGGLAAGGVAGLGALAGAAQAATGVLVGFVGAVAPAAGAILLLPAAAFAGGAAMAALKIGMQGFGDALKAMDDPAKFAEAIAKLSPSARAAAVAVKGLQPAWKGLQMEVQERLFANTGEAIAAMGARQIPILKAGLGGIATGFNTAATSTMKYLAGARAGGFVETILGNTATSAQRLGNSLLPVVDGMLNLGQAGSKYLPAMAAGIDKAAGSFMRWSNELVKSGQFDVMVQNALTVLRQLGTVLSNIGGIIGGVFRAANAAGGSFLQNLVTLTTKANEFINSFEGQAALTAFFTTAGQLATALGGVLGGVIGVIGAVGTALNGTFLVLGPAVQAVLVGLAEGIRSMAPGILFVVQGVAQLLTVLAPLLPAIGSFANGLLLVVGYLIQWGTAILSWVVPPLTALIGMLGAAGPMWAPIVAGIISLVAAYKLWQMAHTAALAVISFVKFAATMAVGVAQVVARLAVMTAATVAWGVRMAATMAVAVAQTTVAFIRMAAGAAVYIASLVATAVATVAQWAVMAAGAMARAVIMAAAWFVALGPIGWVIAAVIGLVVLIIANWDTVKNATIAAWNAVVAFVVNVWNRIKQIVMSVLMWMIVFVLTTWARIQATFQAGVQAVVGFVQQLPARIRAFFANAATWLINAGKAILDGLLNGLKAAWNAVAGWVGDIGNKIKALKGPMSYDKVMLKDEGKAIMHGLGRGMGDGWKNVEKQVKGYTRDLSGSITAKQVFSGLGNDPMAQVRSSLAMTDFGSDLGSKLESAVRNGINGAKLKTDKRGTTEMVNDANLALARRGRVR